MGPLDPAGVGITADGSPAPATGRARPRPRPAWHAPEALPSSLQVRPAASTDEVAAALRLVHDQYVAHGYMSRHPTGRRLSLQHALPSTRVFVAADARRVVGTLTLIPDSPLRLPMDEIYGVELDGLRRQARAIAEVSAFALDPAYRAAGVAIIVRMVRLAIIAAEQAGVDDTCVAVNPHHVDFYLEFLRFSPLGERRDYRKVNGAPAVALRFDVGAARHWIAMLSQGRTSLGLPHDFFFGPAHVAAGRAALRRDARRAEDPFDRFARLFAGHDVLASATADELGAILHGLARESRTRHVASA
ncbi:MAG: hypothetical protein HY294_10955 [Candidatus Rokubacteria bacterium]|nr:hypothetical protein [Candidatus Rokubacteria bacterium]